MYTRDVEVGNANVEVEEGFKGGEVELSIRQDVVVGHRYYCVGLCRFAHEQFAEYHRSSFVVFVDAF